MSYTRDVAELVFRIVPDFEYQFTRPCKLFAKEDMTNYQSKILTVLANETRISMSELANFIVMSKSQLTYNIDCLVKAGYVARIPDNEDRRKIYIQLTEQGNAYMEKVKENMGLFFDDYYDHFTEEEKEDLLKTLTRLEKLLERFNEPVRMNHQNNE